MKKLLVALLIGLGIRAGYCDTKISAMPEATSLQDADIFPVVTDPATTPTNKKITKANLKTTLGIGSILTDNLPGASTSYVQANGSLQSGATFYVSSGTVAQEFHLVSKLPLAGGIPQWQDVKMSVGNSTAVKPTYSSNVSLVLLGNSSYPKVELGSASDVAYGLNPLYLWQALGDGLVISPNGQLYVEGSTATIKLYNGHTGGIPGTNHYLTISRSTASVVSDYTLSLPAHGGDANELLASVGTSTLTWTRDLDLLSVTVSTITASSVTVQNITINGTCTGSGCGTSGSGGYNVEPATVAFQLNQGVSGSTAVFTSSITADSFRTSGPGAGRYTATEGAAPSGSAGSDIIYADSTAHRWKMINNNGTAEIVAGSTNTWAGGKCLQSTGNGTVTEVGAACGTGGSSGDAVLAGTQTWTGGNTFNAAATINSTFTINGLAMVISTGMPVTINSSMTVTDSVRISSDVVITQPLTVNSSVFVASNTVLPGTTAYADGLLAVGRASVSTLTVTGSFYDTGIKTVNANYQALSGDSVILASSTLSVNGGITVTLPQASTVIGQTLLISKVDLSTNPVILKGFAGDVIHGTGTVKLNAYTQSAQLVSVGTVNGMGMWAPYGIGLQVTPAFAGQVAMGNTANTVGTSSVPICGAWTTQVPVAIDSMTVWVGTAKAGAVVDLGVYDNSGNRVGSSGAITMNAAVGKLNFPMSSVIQVPPGTYWLCLVSNNTTPTFFSSSATNNQFGGWQSCAAAAGNIPLPATLPFPCGSTARVVDYNLMGHIIGGTW